MRNGFVRCGFFSCSLRLAGVLLLVLWLGGGWVGCEEATPARSGPPTYSLRLGAVEFTAELALTVEEMTQGLMHRVELPPNHGMLFVFNEAGRRSFWMKNTHIPLDLGYFTGDGVLREIHPLVPNNLTPVASRRADIVYALEMNRGWFARHGVEPGAQLEGKSLQQALEAARARR